jgi:hypothetical protein
MRAKLCCTLLTVSICAGLLPACFGPAPQGSHVVSQTPHMRVTESALNVGDLVVNLTLEHFWNLASLQIRDQSAAARLLATNPRDPSISLGPLNVGFDTYRQQLAQGAGVNPVVLFMPHGADPEEEARRHGLPPIYPWPRQTPPAFFSGPTVDTLILFVSATSARRELPRGGPVVLARIASAAGLTGLWLAEGATPEQLGARLYRVQPREWKKSAIFEHTRCLYQGPDVKLVTKLTYQGGVTDSKTTPLTDKDWGPCTLDPDPKLRAAIVKQPGNRKPGRPAIVAGSYFLNPYPHPFLSDYISVK